MKINRKYIFMAWLLMPGTAWASELIKIQNPESRGGGRIEISLQTHLSSLELIVNNQKKWFVRLPMASQVEVKSDHYRIVPELIDNIPNGSFSVISDKGDFSEEIKFRVTKNQKSLEMIWIEKRYKGLLVCRVNLLNGFYLTSESSGTFQGLSIPVEKMNFTVFDLMRIHEVCANRKTSLEDPFY